MKSSCQMIIDRAAEVTLASLPVHRCAMIVNALRSVAVSEPSEQAYDLIVESTQNGDEGRDFVADASGFYFAEMFTRKVIDYVGNFIARTDNNVVPTLNQCVSVICRALTEFEHVSVTYDDICDIDPDTYQDNDEGILDTGWKVMAMQAITLAENYRIGNARVDLDDASFITYLVEHG